MAGDFRVLDVARQVVDELETLLDASGRRLLHAGQLRKAVGSIPFNIREGYGRGEGDDRKRFLRVARASAEEVDEQLRTNLAAHRVPEKKYWRLHNRLVVITKMLDSLTE